MPVPGCFYERVKDRLGVLIIIEAALRMPLHADDEVVGRGALDSFYGSILRADRTDQQAIAGNCDRLVMAGVDVDLW